MEANYGRGRGGVKLDKKAAKDGVRVFFREHRSAVQIVEESLKLGEDFIPYRDEVYLGDEMDQGGSCSDGCEIDYD